MIFLLFACKSADPKPNSSNATQEPSSETIDCPTDFEYFQSAIEPIVQSQCSGCHSSQGAGNATQLVLELDSSADYETLSDLARVEDDGHYLLLLKPTNTHPSGHSGGEMIVEGSEVYDQLELFVARENDLVDDCAETVDLGPLTDTVTCDGEIPAPRLLRRLSHVEYRNTMYDLFGIDVNLADFAADNVAFGYNNNSDALTVSALLLDQYSTVSETIAQSYVEQSAPSTWGCSTANRACAEVFLTSKATEIWRRPLNEIDVGRYLEMYDLAEEDGFVSGMTWMLSGLLQSPHFLYRPELGERQSDDTFALTSWEIATELSYLIWQTTPDDDLLAQAVNDELIDPEQRRLAVERLMADPRAAESMVNMGDQWLQLDLLPIVARDATIYGDLNAQIRTEMAMETSTYLSQLFTEGAPFKSLLTDERTWIGPGLASYYDLSVSPDTWGEVDLSQDERYGGLLTQGAVLTVHALPSSSSPIHRGVLIRERFLCEELLPPPPNLDTSPPPVDPTLSTRDRYDQHSSDPACASCHQLIDPIGFAFENYDGIGRWREQDGEHPIDASGEIVASLNADAEFDGLMELAEHLSQADQVSACYVQQWFTFGTGRGDMHTEEVACGVEAAVAEFDAAGATLPAAILALTNLDRIHIRGGEAGEMDTFASSQPIEVPVEPEPDTAEPDDTAIVPSEDLLVTVSETTNWGSGACYAVQVSNQGSAPETWAVEIVVPGTITSLWSAESEATSDGILFYGLDWNATLQPQQSTEFGYCVQL